jgi:hypothetical protein
VAKYEGIPVNPSPLVNVTDSSRTVMTDLPPSSILAEWAVQKAR